MIRGRKLRRARYSRDRFYFSLDFQPRHEACPVPKLNVVTIKYALGLRYSLAIVATDQRFKSHKVPVKTDDIGPIFQQWGDSLQVRRER
jgi:hypothetical protein